MAKKKGSGSNGYYSGRQPQEVPGQLPSEHGDLRYPVEATCNVYYYAPLPKFLIFKRDEVEPDAPLPKGPEPPSEN